MNLLELWGKVTEIVVQTQQQGRSLSSVEVVAHCEQYELDPPMITYELWDDDAVPKVRIIV